MEELHAGNVPQNHVVGVRDWWYAWDKDHEHFSHRTTADVIQEAYLMARFHGVLISKNVNWRPEPVPYESEAYLFDGIVLMYSQLKKNPDGVKIDIPTPVIALIAKTKEEIQQAATKLRLPLEALVQDNA